MKLIVLGATGRTGRQIVSQALAAGHAVTALARDRAKVGHEHERLRVIAADVQDRAALEARVRGHDAVISAIGRGDSFTSEHLIERSVPGIIAAMQAADVRRLMFMSAMGVGDSFAQAPLIPKIFFGTLLRGIYADKLAGETLIRKSDLEWTIVQPSRLTDGPLTRRYRWGESVVMSGQPAISRADTAHFILDRLHDPAAVRKSLIVTQ